MANACWSSPGNAEGEERAGRLPMAIVKAAELV